MIWFAIGIVLALSGIFIYSGLRRRKRTAHDIPCRAGPLAGRILIRVIRAIRGCSILPTRACNPLLTGPRGLE
jgi:hypothetical protein